MSSKSHLKSIHEGLQGALEASEKLQKDYDKMLDDIIIIAAELGSKANYEAVIARIKELRAIEATYSPEIQKAAAFNAEIARREALAAQSIDVIDALVVPAPAQVAAE